MKYRCDYGPYVCLCARLQVKYEWWWLYVVDRKISQLIRLPLHITSLKDEEEVGISIVD